MKNPSLPLAVKTWLKIALVTLALCLALPMGASADPLDDARNAGLVGESPDGYVASVSATPSGDIKNLIDNINAQRRKVYEKLAGEKGVPVEEVGALAAEKTISQRLKPGWYYLDSSGQWVKK